MYSIMKISGPRKSLKEKIPNLLENDYMCTNTGWRLNWSPAYLSNWSRIVTYTCSMHANTCDRFIVISAYTIILLVNQSLLCGRADQCTNGQLDGWTEGKTDW